MKTCYTIFYTFLPVVCLMMTFGCAKEPQRSGIDKHAYRLMIDMGNAAIQLEHALADVAGLKILNTPGRMKNAQAIIRKGETGVQQARQAVTDYRNFVLKNKQALKKEKLDHYIDIVGAAGPFRFQRLNTISDYFRAMKKWLTYSAAHYEQIKAGSRSHRATYDSLLIDVNRKLERYNAANDRYEKFLHGYMAKHPAIPAQFKREYKNLKKEMGWL